MEVRWHPAARPLRNVADITVLTETYSWLTLDVVQSAIWKWRRLCGLINVTYTESKWWVTNWKGEFLRRINAPHIRSLTVLETNTWKTVIWNVEGREYIGIFELGWEGIIKIDLRKYGMRLYEYNLYEKLLWRFILLWKGWRLVSDKSVASVFGVKKMGNYCDLGQKAVGCVLKRSVTTNSANNVFDSWATVNLPRRSVISGLLSFIPTLSDICCSYSFAK